MAFDENKEIARPEHIDGNEFNLVLGTSSIAFYPEYTVYYRVRLGTSSTNPPYYVPIRVHFTTEPDLPDAVTKSQGLKSCP